jgi:hypothetical protein
MPWLRHFALFLVFVTALFRPAAAGAFVSAPDAGPQVRVGAFELVAATLVGPTSAVTCGLHERIAAAYDENASGYRFAAGGTGRLLTNALQPFKGGSLTQAGRALTKHPEVLGYTKETLRTALRTDPEINAAAARALEGILGGTRTAATLPRYGAVVEFRGASGFGARFYAETGEFIGFINP